MNFCNICDNMYYIKLSETEDNKLIYYCRKCGNETNIVDEENMCVLNTNFNQTEQGFNTMINPYTKLDPTLPRVNNLKCPNSECLSNLDNEEHKTEIIYLRYDDINMNYVYLCVVCNKVWTMNN